jgi:hypothetical protein
MLAPAVLAAETLTEALTGGKTSLQMRYRYEWVEQEGNPYSASASTMRTQLGYATGDYYGFGAFLQFEDVRVIGDEHYNSTVNGLMRYPTVVDPESTEVNQAYLSYKGVPGTLFRYGRQVIVYDNHRFIGDVGWRQNQQTFDAFSVANTSLPDTTISYAHAVNANRIFGERHATQADVELKGDWLNLAYKGLSFGSIVGYAYLLDFEPGQTGPTVQVTSSNKTLGLRFDGGIKLGAPKLLYTAEYAKQNDYADGAATVDADYYFAMLGVEFVGVQIKLNYEVLSGDGVYALQTPFATLHAFNGWADKFLVTPADGLIDSFLSVGGRVASVNLLGMYHLYGSDNLGYEYGQELNLLVSWKLNKYLTLLTKYANYQGDKNSTNVARNGGAPSTDLSKAWLQAEVQF